MEKILIVEDSIILATLMARKIHEELGLDFDIAHSLAETMALLENNDNDYFLAILDLKLPDALQGEVVDYVKSKGIPPIVVTGDVSDDTREYILSKHIVDYILKQGAYSIDFLIKQIDRLIKNVNRKILVVDDSRTSRSYIRSLLELQKFTVIESTNGVEALHALENDPEISMILTDNNMPEMGGFELTTKIRKKHSFDQKAIIGFSARGNAIISAKFLKKGANDFLTKPFSIEEFYWRINQNMEILENFQLIKEAAIKDYLTNLYNRRYFFDIGNTLFENAKRDNLDITIALLDLDHFKELNDKCGHLAGDYALKEVAKTIKNHFRKSDVVARYGGEEFCIIATELKKEKSKEHFEKLRKKIENLNLLFDENPLCVTVSIGVTTTLDSSLEETLKKADVLLYESKSKGRNLVIFE